MSITDHIPTMTNGKLPAALVAAFLLQLSGALFWAGSAAQRISVLEQTLAGDQAAIQRVAVLEEQVTNIRTQLTRIETKLDRISAPSAPR